MVAKTPTSKEAGFPVFRYLIRTNRAQKAENLHLIHSERLYLRAASIVRCICNLGQDGIMTFTTTTTTTDGGVESAERLTAARGLWPVASFFLSLSDKNDKIDACGENGPEHFA